ncbi:TolB family protein, partial [Staphylococcus aureus]|uniref:TolB family protein n=1 Tax=Staphylococcus aureus TaxID=1280 RepID=UPI003C6F5F30
VSYRDGTPHIYLYDFATNAETRLTNDARADASPRFSLDGKQLAFIRDARELRTIKLDTKQERLLVAATFERPPVDAERPFVWSPDSRFIAYLPVA